MYEVELKFPVDDHAPVVTKLIGLGAQAGETQQQRDEYFSHPQRSFAETDEALRVRCVGRRNRITYKGPVVDDKTKTRREIEIAFEDGTTAAEQFAEMLSLLGFHPVRIVEKSRIPYHLRWRNRDWEIALDEVENLGVFVEIETQADKATRAAAQAAILELAVALELAVPERRSYLCLLLEQDAAQ